MLTDIEQISTSGMYGMPKEHMEILIQAAVETDYVISFRSVNKFAHYYLLNRHPTKPFCFKNKTSKEGPMAGLIAINPLYGRETTKEGYEKHTKYLEIGRSQDQEKNLINVALTLTEERIKELHTLLIGSNTAIKDPSDEKPYYAFTWQKGTQIVYVKAVKNKLGTYSVVDKDDQPIEVLGRDIEGQKLPITADYDLFGVFPRKDQLDPAFFDKNPFWTQGKSSEHIQKQVKESEENAKLPPEKRKPNFPQEYPHAGNWSPRVEKFSIFINNKMLHKVVHHNEEQKSPFADDLKANLPCLFVFPKAWGFSRNSGSSVKTNIVLIETVEEMVELRNRVQTAGYYWSPHAKYKQHFSSFNSKIINAVHKAVQLLPFRFTLDKTVSDFEMANEVFGQQSNTFKQLRRK